MIGVLVDRCQRQLATKPMSIRANSAKRRRSHPVAPRRASHRWISRRARAPRRAALVTAGQDALILGWWDSAPGCKSQGEGRRAARQAPILVVENTKSCQPVRELATLILRLVCAWPASYLFLDFLLPPCPRGRLDWARFVRVLDAVTGSTRAAPGRDSQGGGADDTGMDEVDQGLHTTSSPGSE